MLRFGPALLLAFFPPPSLLLGASDLNGVVLNVRVSRSGPKDFLNAPEEALEKDFSSRFRGEGADLIFAGSDAGAGRGGDLALDVHRHSRDLKGGLYFCQLWVEVRGSTCYQKNFQVSNQGYDPQTALKGLHRQLLDALLGDAGFRDCLVRRAAVADRGAARGIFGQAARSLWKASKSLWGGTPVPTAGIFVIRPNKRKQYVPAPQAGQRLKGAMEQVVEPGRARFLTGDELYGLLKVNGVTAMAMAGAASKGSPLPVLKGLDYMIIGRLEPGPLGYRLLVSAKNATSGYTAASGLGCCEPEASLPVEPLMDSVGFEVIPGR